MSEERERHERERSRLQHEAEHSRPRKKPSVVSYLAILFAAAFLLLLLSYFMQQRTSEQTINDLKNNVNSFQSVETLVDANKRLDEENKALEEQVDQLQAELDATNTSAKANEDLVLKYRNEMIAMDWFWRIQRAYSRGDKSEAKSLIEQFEATDYPASLSTTSIAVPDGPSPADQYDALLEAVGLKKTEP